MKKKALFLLCFLTITIHARAADEDWRQLVSSSACVSVQSGRHSGINQSGHPLIVKRKDNLDGDKAVLIKFNLEEFPQGTSQSSVIWFKGKAFGDGQNASLSIYAVEDDWDETTVTYDTLPRKIERLAEVTLKLDVNGTIFLPVSTYARQHLRDDRLSFLIEMRSTPGFSQTVEFCGEPLLAIVKAQKPRFDLQKLLRPVWKGSRMENETLLPTSYDGNSAEANLAFIPSKIVSVKNYALDKVYEEGRDYTFDGRTVRLTEGSSIPFFCYEELYHNNPDAKPGVKETIDGGYLTFSESALFNDKQLAVTYEHNDTWEGPIPQSAAEHLPKTFKILERGEPLKLVVFGDSISVGASASGQTVRPPFMPRWADLVAEELHRRYASDIDYMNPSLGGMASDWGRATVDGLVSFEKPDLVILGFGMNDNGKISAEHFAENIRTMMTSIRKQNPEVEFILLMSFQPNSKWHCLETMENYLMALREMEGVGVAVADVWSMHGYLLKHKTYWDMTGNHVNHPNDFMVRIYAQTVLATLGIE